MQHYQQEGMYILFDLVINHVSVAPRPPITTGDAATLHISSVLALVLSPLSELLLRVLLAPCFHSGVQPAAQLSDVLAAACMPPFPLSALYSLSPLPPGWLWGLQEL